MMLARSGTEQTKQNAPAGSGYLASGSQAIKQAVVSAGAVDALVQLARSGTEGHEQCAAVALADLASGSQAIKQVAVSAGAVPLW